MTAYRYMTTDRLEIGYLEWNPQGARTAVLLHGWPESSAGREHFFKGRYERQVLDGVGHFPQREAPREVAQAILAFCAV